MKRILLLALPAMFLGGTFGVRAQSNCFNVICAPPKTVSCSDTNWSFDPPIVVDTCCHNYAVIPVGLVVTGTCPQYVTQAWRVVDNCGHSNQCSQTVTVVNTNQPVFQGATNITVFSCTNVVVSYNVTASEACCGPLSVVCSPPSGSSFAPGSTPVEYLTTDCCGRTFSNVFFVDLINTNQPVFQGVGNITLTSCSATNVFYNPTATEACCGALNVVCSPPSGSLFQPGATQVSCSVVDCNSNVFTTSFYVAVNGGPGVQLVCTNKSVVCGTDWNYDPPTIYDPCCPYTNYVIGYEGPFTNGIGPCAQTNSIIWIVFDQCGYSNSCEQFVTILNTLLVYPTNQFISCDAPVPTNPPSYFSGCCSNVTFSLLETFTNSSGCDQLLSQVWQATDCCSNLITVTNTVTVLPASPTILCASNKVIGSTACALPNGAAAFAVLYSFPQTNTDGMNPRAGLLLGSDLVLYGTTYNGGAYGTGGGGFGTVFKINQDGTGYEVIHNFDGSGENPTAGLIEGANGALYGTTALGGNGFGTLFKLNKDGTGFQVLHNFDSGNPAIDGDFPQAGLVLAANGTLYGTTSAGGQYGYGTVFSFDALGTYTVLYSFGNGSGDGQNPWGALVVAPDGALYGTTKNGGTDSFGSIFRLNLDGSGYLQLYSFGLASGDGIRPLAGLVAGSGGILYGTASFGGVYGLGTVYAFQTNGLFTTLYSFGGFPGDGNTPYAGLLVGCDQALYGTTYAGGDSGFGTAFTLNQDGTGYAVLKSFTASDGVNPYGGLAQGSDGLLYGATSGAGPNGSGTLFQLPLTLAGLFDPPTLLGGCCGTNVSIQVVSTIGVNTPCGQSVTRTWLITDCCGNTNVCNQTVTVGSTNGPVLNCPTIAVTCGTPIPTNPPTAYSPGCSNVLVTLLGQVTNSLGCTQFISRAWQAVDCCSNSAVCTQLVTVVTAPPVLTCAPLTVPAGSPIPTNPPSVVANCCTNVTVFLAGSVTNSVGCTNFIYQDWQAIDCCGQTTNCTRVVTVTCPSNCLTIECPSNILVVACSNGATVYFPTPLATDTCCSNVFFSFNPPSGTFFAAGTSNYPVQVTATDSCGSNTATCGFSVTVLAATEPVVSLLTTQVTVTACSSGCGLGPDVANLVVITGGNSGPYFISQNPPGGPAPGNYLICGDTNITITVSNSCGWFTNLYVGVRMQIVCTNPATCLNFCPPDIVVTNCGTGPVPVFFDTICGLAACCDNSKVFYCFSPPSGSLFPADGLPRPVTATLSDYCRDTNICVFTVTVIPNTNLPAIIAPTNITLCTGATVAGPLVVDGGSQDLTTAGFCAEGDGATYATNIAWYVTRRSADPSRTNVLIYSTQYLPSKASEGDSLALALEAAGFNVMQDPPPWPCSASCIAPGFSNSLAFYLNNPSNHFDAVFLGGSELYGDQNYAPGAGIINYFLAGARPYPLNQPDGIPALMNFLTNGGGVFLAAEGGAACSSGVNDNCYAQWSQVLLPLGLNISYPWNVSIGGDYCSWTWIYLCPTNPIFGGANLTVPDGTLTVLPSPVVNGVTNLFYSGGNEVFVTGASPIARLVAFAGTHGLVGVSGCIIATNSGCGVMPDVASLFQFHGGGPVTVNQSIPPGATVCADTTVLVTISNACGLSTNFTLPVILGPSCANCLTLECPSNVVVTTCSNNAPVYYTPYVNDVCTTNWTLTAVPPSGSLFPLGATTVSASVVDALGNSNSCSFIVTVLSPHLTISRNEGTISLTWAGGGTLETANTITGPWTPIPGAVSPYTTPAVEAAKFYRFVCH